MTHNTSFSNIECFECGNLRSLLWCSLCETETFIRNFHRWTSGNTMIDQVIQHTQRHASNDVGYLEWIPFENFDLIEYRARGAFSIVYSGIWLEGPRRNWDEENEEWLRNGPTKCALKRIENSNQMSREYLNNIMRNHQCLQGRFVVDCFGITRDPTGCYMFVTSLCEENLYQYIDKVMGYLRWEDIVKILYEIIKGLKRIHDNGLYHGNLHGGNLLIEDKPEGVSIRISDIGLHGPADKTASVIYGVLPYVAPEVLKGNEYTQASDIYSFGIIMWTLSTCMRPFCRVPHDLCLAKNICNGLRPEIINSTPKVYSTLMERCWYQDPNKRPKVTELRDILSHWVTAIYDNSISNLLNAANNDRITSENIIFVNRTIHHNAVYNSRLVNFQSLHEDGD
ncbi:kinase-like domain-containing protein [Gigaspora rosea]|uniref:Kinase-like domain-containing protein n=1 Tax=Gigaspora rosea TaxID=44941 RepID=A0A397ULS7_9GLOM|nr:kinase-like domain-containing protein [Gigaspora rosea]